MDVRQITIVVPAAVVEDMRELARSLGKGDLDGMFTAALSPTGAEPATHYVSSGLLPVAYQEAFLDATKLRDGARRAVEAAGKTFAVSPARVAKALSSSMARTGLRRVEHAGAQDDIPESPHDVIASMGLQLIGGNA